MVVILLWRDKFDKTCTATDYDVWRDKTSATTRTGEKFCVWWEHTVHELHRNIWTTANQRGVPPFIISYWFRPWYGPNVCLLLKVDPQGDFQSRRGFLFLNSWLHRCNLIFFSRTIEKLGRMCDQIGRTLEPWGSLVTVICGSHLLPLVGILWYCNFANHLYTPKHMLSAIGEGKNGKA